MGRTTRKTRTAANAVGERGAHGDAPSVADGDTVASQQFWTLAGVICLLIGLALRVAAARGDLWLDEVVTFAHSQGMAGALDVFKAKKDNNHLLNTLWFYLIGEHRASLLYRLPAIITGAGAIVIAGLVNQGQTGKSSRSTASAFAVGAAIMGFSYMMVHYSSEARGYSSAVFFSLCAVLAATRTRLWSFGHWTFVYWVCCALALLSHPVAGHAIVGVFMWQLAECFLRVPGLGRREGLARLAIWQTPVALTALSLYWGFFRHLEIFGGPVYDPIRMGSDAAAFSLGLPSGAYLGLFGAGVLLIGGTFVVFSGGIEAQRRKTVLVFYWTAILLSPVLVNVVAPQRLVYERYFIINATMLLLLAAQALSILAARGRGWTLGVWLAIGVFITANLALAVPLLRYGRGQYRAAIVAIQDASPADRPRTIAGDEDNRIAPLLVYYSPELVTPGRLRYVPGSYDVASAPDWFIVGWQNLVERPPETFALKSGDVFTLFTSYPSAPMSGFSWSLYSRAVPR